MSQMSFVAAAYALGLGAIAALLSISWTSMIRAERHAARLRAERRR